MKYTLLASNYKEPPTFVLGSSNSADSPYHAGLLFGKEMHSAKTRTEFSIVISDTKKEQYEIHMKKRKTKGGWMFFGQVHKRKVKGTFALPAPIPAPVPMNTPANEPKNNQTPGNNEPRNNQTPANNGPKNNQTPSNNGPRNNQTPVNNGPKNNQTPANNNGPKNNQVDDRQNGQGNNKRTTQ